MTAAILDFSMAVAARFTGEKRLAYPWSPAQPLPLADLDSAGGFHRGDRVLLAQAPGMTGTIARLFPCPRSGAPRAHVVTPTARVSVPVAELSAAPSYL